MAVADSLPRHVVSAQDGRTPIRVTNADCRNEIVHRFMAVLALAGAVTVSDTVDSLGSPPTAPLYESAFWLLESFLKRNVVTSGAEVQHQTIVNSESEGKKHTSLSSSKMLQSGA